MKRIPFGEGVHGAFSFPIDAATQTFAFIARRGAGKTYAVGKLVEGLYDVGSQVIILDSVGNWWGLRVAANGKDRGLDIPMLGGLRGDIPLNPEAGALIADIAADSQKSLIIDISQFSKKDRQRFATAFGERLWARKKAERSPSPVHLVIEECHLIVPENVGKDQTTMVGIYEEIIRLGRNFGIGCTLIDQRPQSVNKEVLNQTEVLCVLQINGPHERKAVKEWVVQHGVDVNLVDELPGLPIGTAWVWSPQWLQKLEKVKVGKKRTFDSTATPKPGQKRATGKIKPLDLTALQEKMKEIVQEAAANDPRKLKDKLAQTEILLGKKCKELEALQAAPPKIVSDKNSVKLADLRAELARRTRALELAVKLLEAVGIFGMDQDAAIDLTAMQNGVSTAIAMGVKTINAQIAKRNLAMANMREKAGAMLLNARQILDDKTIVALPPAPVVKIPGPRIYADQVRGPASAASAATREVGDMPPRHIKLLDSLATWEDQGVREPSRRKVALACQRSAESSGFEKDLGALRTSGHITYPQDGHVALTDAGRAIGKSQGTLSVDQFRGWAKALMSPRHAQIIDALAESGQTMDRATLGETSGRSSSSSGFEKDLGALRSAGFIVYPSDGLVALSELLGGPSE